MSVTADGALGSTQFTGAVVTFTGVGDTADIQTIGGGVRLLLESPSVDVAGVGSGVFTDPFDIEIGKTAGDAILQDETHGVGHMFSLIASGLIGYDLSTPIGPLTGTPGAFITGIMYATTGGDFSFNGDEMVTGTVTFQAAAVPEPSTFLLGAMAAGIGVVTARLRRRRGRRRMN